MERSLYNNVISGVGMDGKTFFYPNPLSCDLHYNFNADNTITRQPWFDCSRCPTNLCRFMASVPEYIYAQKDNDLFVNLFITSKMSLLISKKVKVEVAQKTNYPWDGNIAVSVDPSRKTKFTFSLRIPGWTQDKPVPSDLYSYANPTTGQISVKINGKQVVCSTENGYVKISREWKKGDRIEYNLPMEIHRVRANGNVKVDEGKIALERGHIVFCLEGVDNPDGYGYFLLPDDAELSFSSTNKLNGAYEVKGVGIRFTISDDSLSVLSDKQEFTAIPYYQWCNRGKSTMEVWIPNIISELSISGK